MSTYTHKIYLLLYTYLTEAENESCCINKCCIYFDTQRPPTSRMTTYISPPFIHVKIAYLKGDKLRAIGIEQEGGIVSLERDFLHRPGFSVLSLSVTKNEYDEIVKLIETMVNKGDIYFSLMKMSQINGRLRKYFLCAPAPYPTIDTKKWMCSEFVGWVLQEKKILPKIFHPSYISATELFLICAASNRCKKTEMNPCAKISAKYTKEMMQLTNSIYVYLVTMNITSGILPVLNHKTCFAMDFLVEDDNEEHNQEHQMIVIQTPSSTIQGETTNLRSTSRTQKHFYQRRLY